MILRIWVLTLLTCLAMLAAEQGQVSGTVFGDDKSGISGAKLTATNPETKQSQEATTNASGSYLMKLPEGTYDLLVESASHAAFHQKVYITPGADNTVNIHLTPAAARKPPGKR